MFCAPIKCAEILRNCVTAARQTLTLFVGVRIPIPQPKRNDNFRQKVVASFYIITEPQIQLFFKPDYDKMQLWLRMISSLLPDKSFD